MLADQLDYVVGVDPHRDAHSIGIVDVRTGAVVFEAAVRADTAGYEEALRLAEQHAPGRRAFAVEGTASFGAGLTRFLVDGGEQVFEVGRLRRERRSGGETDALPATRGRHHAVSTESLPSDAEAEGGQMTLVEHLTELRKRLIISVVAVGIGMLVVFIFYDPIFDFLVSPYCATSDDCRLLQTDPLEGFGVRMRVAGYGGIALAMPVILWQLWRFVAPGLYANEKRYAIPFVASAVTLFVLGAGIAYATMPMALEFLADIGGDNLEQFYSPNRYFRLVTYMMLAFGIGFEFPILLLFLIMAGVLEVDMLRRGRRMAFVIITVVVALITPSGDPYSMLALSLPMILFYEIALRIGSLIEKRRAAAEAAEVAGPAG